MTRDVLDVAASLMKRRRFNRAIVMLENRSDIYEGNFDYYILLAVSYLYVGDTGAAASYFQRARKIKLTDTTLLLGQAALFLRRGDTKRAIEYYMEALDNDPANKVALSALEFIKEHGDYDTICRWVDTGRIAQFYPPYGASSVKFLGILLPVAACALGALIALRFSPILPGAASAERADLSAFVLSVDAKKHLQQKDLSSGAYRYVLSPQQISRSYEKAIGLFQEYRDNAAQVEINRILNSNASEPVKKKAQLLTNYIETPSFDTIKDSPSYADVKNDSLLYMNCWVSWAGRVGNVAQDASSYSCDLLVGYETMQNVEGIVPLKFSVPPQIDTGKAVRVLAKITSDGGKLSLEGHAVYQSVKDMLETQEK